MAVTPERLPRHELNGLRVRVVEATDPDRVGIRGRVVVETTRTLHVECADGRVRQVPKQGTTFEFAIGEPDPATVPTADPSGDVEYVTVDGARLAARPARRTERTGDSRWR